MTPPLPIEPSPFFMGAYISLCSLMFLGCMFHAIKIGIWAYYNRNQQRSWLPRIASSLTQVMILIFFATAYWLLESYATFESPYYVYSQFPGAIPQLFYALGYTPAETDLACPALVGQLKALGPNYNTIPFSVLMMESSITYVAMWTALMLRARYYLIPIFAGIFMLNVDVLMDPVVAVVYDCSGNVLRGGSGLAFWHWYTGETHHMAGWYGVPLFNFAAWWAAPVTLVSCVLLVRYLRHLFSRASRERAKADPALVTSHAAAFGLTIGVIAVVYTVNVFRPAGPVPPYAQWIAMAAVIVVCCVLIFFGRRHFESSGRADPWLTHPPLALIAVSLVGLFLNAIFLDLPTLLPVALIATVVALLLVLWPYEDTMCWIARVIVDLDRYIRLHYFGYTSTLILLGGFAAGIERGRIGIIGDHWITLVGSLLATGISFQIYAYVLNDVIDLEVDFTQEKRRRDPLIRGAVRWSTALALALVQIPASLLFLWMVGAPWQAFAALLAGFALMTVYNRWGKVCPFPPLTDLAQALAWGSLVWVGAFTAESPSSATHWAIVWGVFIFGAGYILSINGIHGGLRDLRNDCDQGRKTTALLLGAHCDPATGQVRSTWRVVAFAFTVHTLMFALPPLIMLRDPPHFESASRLWPVAICLFGVFLVSNYFLWRVVRPFAEDADRDKWVERHLFFLLVPFVVGALPFLDLISEMAMVVVFFGPLLTLENVVGKYFFWFARPGHPELTERVLGPGSRWAAERGDVEQRDPVIRQGRAAVHL